jgi:hypothetical protein
MDADKLRVQLSFFNLLFRRFTKQCISTGK